MAHFPRPKQLTWHVLSRQEVALWNEICSGDIRIRWLEDFFLLRLFPGKAFTGEGITWHLSVGPGHGCLRFWIAPRLLHAHMQRAFGEDLMGDVLSLPPDIRDVVMEVVGEELLDYAGQVLGMEVRRVPAPVNADTFLTKISIEMLHLETGRQAIAAELIVDILALQQLASSLKKVPRERLPIFRTIPIDVGIVLGATEVPWCELRELHPGDIIILDRDYRKDGNRLLLWISPAQQFWLDLGSGSEVFVIGRKEVRMASETQGIPEHDGLVNMDDVFVEVRFEVGRKTITVAELERVGTGYVFSLQTPIDRFVSLYVNHQRIGTGELVEIEGHVGVRVVEMRDDSSR